MFYRVVNIAGTDLLRGVAMTKREFVEQAAMRFRAASNDKTVTVGETAPVAVAEAIELWDEIEKQVPRERDLTLGGLIK